MDIEMGKNCNWCDKHSKHAGYASMQIGIKSKTREIWRSRHECRICTSEYG